MAVSTVSPLCLRTKNYKLQLIAAHPLIEFIPKPKIAMDDGTQGSVVASPGQLSHLHDHC